MKNNIKKPKINLIFIALLAMMIVGQVIALNLHSTKGAQLHKYNKEFTDLHEQNNFLQQKVASLSSIMVISYKARSLGLVKSSQVISLASSLPLASSFGISL